MADAQGNTESPHETRDMSAPLLTGIILGVTVFMPLCGALLWLLFQTLWQNPSYRSLPLSDVSEREEVTAPPLIPNPALNVPESIRRMEERLHSIGWVDRKAGIVHIPIEQAMDRLIERGTSEGVFPLKTGREPKP